MEAKCTCGAALAKHPATGYSESGACLKALEASNVKTACEWPDCAKQVRKVNLGQNFCAAHRRMEHDAFMSMMSIEGPQTLNRPTATIAECYEFTQTGKLPASRLVPVTFATTKVRCADCGWPLIIVNDADWSPELPNSMSCRYTEPGNAASAVPWGIGICRSCTLGATAATA